MDDTRNPESEQSAVAAERESIEELIRTRIAASTGSPADGLAPGTSLGESGLDSLGAVELKSRLEGLGADIPLSDFFSGRTIAELALQAREAGCCPQTAAHARGGQQTLEPREFEEGTL